MWGTAQEAEEGVLVAVARDRTHRKTQPVVHLGGKSRYGYKSIVPIVALGGAPVALDVSSTLTS